MVGDRGMRVVLIGCSHGLLGSGGSVPEGQAATAPRPPRRRPKLDRGDNAWMLTSSALVLMMTGPGLALFYSGLVRKKNVLERDDAVRVPDVPDDRHLGALGLHAWPSAAMRRAAAKWIGNGRLPVHERRAGRIGKTAQSVIPHASRS